jgi:hypothetical protein
LSLNIQSLRNKFHELLVLLLDKNFPDVLVISEVWVYSHELPFYNISDYTMFGKCNDEGISGGVVVYIRNSSQIDVNHVNSQFNSADTVDLRIRAYGTDYALLGIYRSPAKEVQIFLDELEEWCVRNREIRNIVVTGDLNINVDESVTLTSDANTYVNILSNFGLMLHRVGTTRPSRGGGRVTRTNIVEGDNPFVLDDVEVQDYEGTQIDHFVTGGGETHWKVERLECFLSDHFGLYAVKNVAETASAVVRRNVFRRIDYGKLDNIIKIRDWEDVFSSDDLNVCADTLISGVSEAIIQSSTLVTIKSRKIMLQKWMTPALLQCIRKRDRLMKKSKNLPKDHEASIYARRYKNTLRKALRVAKNNFSLVALNKSKGNIAEQFRIVAKYLNLPVKTDTFLSKIMNEKPTAEQEFNEYFTQVGKRIFTSTLNSGVPEFTPNYNLPDSFVLRGCTPDVIRKYIDELSTGKAPGTDGITNAVLVRYKSWFSDILSRLFNLCIEAGVFPRSFKQAVVVPIYKNGDAMDVSNYRPISLLSAVAKLFEKFIHDDMYDFLEKHNILSDSQYGFRKKTQY